MSIVDRTAQILSRAVVVGTTAALVASGCVANEDRRQAVQEQKPGSTTRATASTTPPTPEVPEALYDDQMLTRGHYVAEEFVPNLRFAVAGGRWQMAGPPHPDAVYLGWGPQATSTQGLIFAEWKVVYDDRLRQTTVPPDLIGWIRNHGHLDVGAPRSVRIAGVSGTSLDAAVSSIPRDEDYQGHCYSPFDPCLILAASGTCLDCWDPHAGHYLSLSQRGSRIRFYVVPLGADVDLVIMAQAPARRFGAFLPHAERLLRTLRIESS